MLSSFWKDAWPIGFKSFRVDIFVNLVILFCDYSFGILFWLWLVINSLSVLKYDIFSSTESIFYIDNWLIDLF